MQKEHLSVANIANGELADQINAAIIAVNLELDKHSENDKAIGKVKIEIDLKPAGEGGHFRGVAFKVQPVFPVAPKKFDLYAIQRDESGQRFIVTDPVGEEADDGQTTMFDQPAGVVPQPGVAQFPTPMVANG